jgi:hypothetical protein
MHEKHWAIWFVSTNSVWFAQSNNYFQSLHYTTGYSIYHCKKTYILYMLILEPFLLLHSILRLWILMHTSFIRLIAKLFFSLIIVSLLTLDHISFKGVILFLSLCACGFHWHLKHTSLHGISCTLKYILSGSRLVVGISVSHPLTRPADLVNIALWKTY